MAFPGPKVHRVNRRKLGRGQYPPIPSTSVTAVTATPQVTLNFGSPVIVSAQPGLTVTGLTILSYAQTDPYTVNVIMSGATTGLAWSFDNSNGAVRTFQGGGVASASGSF